MRPGGTIILLEGLGTGYETPHPPDNLTTYYAFLEEKGFSSTWIRTDSQFESLAEAEALTRFFGGDSFAESVTDKLISKDPVILLACTGIWWLRV